MNDQQMKTLLKETKSIAIVGLSPKENRPSNEVARYLMAAGYRVIPVNPGQSEILGQPCFPDMASIGEPVDIVDIFRRSGDTPPIVAEALKLSPKPKAVWLQLGIENSEAAAMAEKAGVPIVMNLCTKIEHERLLGESHGGSFFAKL
ncbi:CoA-binding protein [Desulforhopalus vacuolatus]|uniref:CoA-binding protein n=1 Tax=Desulforhopalus vacuolatus TaxID=40414 RepID=UPI001963F603|nr:CoA-binding protein [Desulforhopalus vacuolatus]MBM9519669.1 CoA-binding protein [Desulforhopalus vacuolatus]